MHHNVVDTQSACRSRSGRQFDGCDSFGSRSAFSDERGATDPSRKNFQNWCRHQRVGPTWRLSLFPLGAAEEAIEVDLNTLAGPAIIRGRRHRVPSDWRVAAQDHATLGMGQKGLAARWTPEQRLRTAVSAHHKTHNSDAAVRTQPAFNKEVQSMGTNQEGRLAAVEKSTPKAPPRVLCCQPCRQSRLRRVLSRVADLIWVV